MSKRLSDRVGLLFLNIGHSYDHLFMLLFPTLVLGLESELNLPYSDLLKLSVPGFIAFAVGTLPAGWLGDRWSRSGMIAVFFFGIGGASILTGFAQSPVQIAAGLTLMGLFASIYHPVGISMVVEGRSKVGKLLGINGVFGNLGVASAAIIAAGIMESISWQAAFIIPGGISIITGALYLLYLRIRPNSMPISEIKRDSELGGVSKTKSQLSSRQVMKRVFTVIAIATILNGIVFQGSIIALPKLFDMGLGSLATSITEVGLMVSIVVAVAAFAQILVGYLIDRFSLKYVWITMLLAQVPLLAVIGMMSEEGMVIVVFAAMLMVIGEVPISDTLVARHTNDAWRSRIYGVKFLFGLGASALAPILIVFFHYFDSGFIWLFIFFAAMALIVGIAAFWLPGSQRLTERTFFRPS